MTKTEYEEQGTTVEGRTWNGERFNQPTSQEQRRRDTKNKRQSQRIERSTNRHQPASLAKSNGEGRRRGARSGRRVGDERRSSEARQGQSEGGPATTMRSMRKAASVGALRGVTDKPRLDWSATEQPGFHPSQAQLLDGKKKYRRPLSLQEEVENEPGGRSRRKVDERGKARKGAREEPLRDTGGHQPACVLRSFPSTTPPEGWLSDPSSPRERRHHHVSLFLPARDSPRTPPRTDKGVRTVNPQISIHR